MELQAISGEKTLLAEVAEGNEAAFRALVHHYAARMGSFIFGFVKSKERTEEVLQDVFLRVWMGRQSLPDVKNFQAYLYVICRNQALNAVRSMVREQRRIAQWKMEFAPESADPRVEDPRSHYLHLIDEAASRLPQQQRLVWELSRRNGLRHAEIASELRLSRETVKKYIRYANESILRFLRQRIGSNLFSFLLIFWF